MSAGKPKKVRQCHMSVSLRYLSFVQRKAQQFRGTPRDRLNWAIDRDRATRNTARTLFLKGYAWVEAIVHALGHECKLNWRISGVGPVTSQLSLVDKGADSSEEGHVSGRTGGGTSSTSKAAIKTVAKRKLKQDKPPESFAERFAARASRACPDFNSKKGCAKNPRHCPNKNPHMCGACGKFGDAKGSQKCAL